MCKKSSFPVIFNIFLAFFITLTVTIMILIGKGDLTPLSFVISMIQGFCLNMVVETLIDLLAFGNFFVKLFHIKMESPLAYFVRIFFIVVLVVLIMSFVLMFCEMAPALGGAFIGVWITKVPAIFLVAYITALIVFIPSLKATQALCVKEG